MALASSLKPDFQNSASSFIAQEQITNLGQDGVSFQTFCLLMNKATGNRSARQRQNLRDRSFPRKARPRGAQCPRLARSVCLAAMIQATCYCWIGVASGGADSLKSMLIINTVAL